jgi:HAMP domain-containing protein
MRYKPKLREAEKRLVLELEELSAGVLEAMADEFGALAKAVTSLGQEVATSIGADWPPY